MNVMSLNTIIPSDGQNYPKHKRAKVKRFKIRMYRNAIWKNFQIISTIFSIN